MKVVDMHCDTIYEIAKRRKRGEDICLRDNDLNISLEKMLKGDYLLQNFAIFTNLERTDDPYNYAMNLIDIFYEEMAKNTDIIGVVYSYKDIEDNIKAGKMSGMLTLEEGAPCEGKLSRLKEFYDRGIRMMTLTWNYPNELGYPNTIYDDDVDSISQGECENERGVTETGIAFLEEMERLGIIVDVSHLGDKGFWDVAEHTKKPFVASHSNARALVPGCPRDLTDDMIRTIADRGGVIGINYYVDFLRNRDDWKEGEVKKSLVSDMVRHMKYIINIGGIGCVGLGSDFDGISSELEMRSAADLPILEEEMEREGFTNDEIEAVFFKNVLRVYKEILS